MRRFNYTGPVYGDEHYIVKRQEMYIDFKSKIDEGRYFTIFAPRQMGKTTFLKEVIRNINQDDHYIGINLDFERYMSFDSKKFYKVLHRELTEAIINRLLEIKCPSAESISKKISKNNVTDNDTFFLFVKKLGKLIPDKKLIFLIDEFDATPIEITGNFLYTLRDMYLKRREEKAFSIYSIGLVGVKNIRELNFGSTSPFNIATQVKLENFTLEQCYELINQYIDETGQGFEKGVIEKIHFETGGHPFLVNRLCAIMVEDIAIGKKRTIGMDDFEKGVKLLLKDDNSNFFSLQTNAKKEQEILEHILFNEENIPYLHFNEKHQRLLMYGIIKEEGEAIDISSPIYKQVLIQTFSAPVIRSKGSFFSNGITPSTFVEKGIINLHSMLIHFKQFVERIGVRLFDIVPSRKESAGQYLLMSYLDLFIRTLDGYSTLETPSGRGRIDVLLHYKGKRYVIELKIWRGKEYHEKGKKQLIDYLKSEGLKEGYMVLFDPRDKEFKDFKDNQVMKESRGEYKIVSFVINI